MLLDYQKPDKAYLEELLTVLNLRERRHHLPSQLSGGQQQRVPISARVHKRQSRMTRICIILAVFLVTSIFSLLEMWMYGQATAMRSKHGDWHIARQTMRNTLHRSRL